MFSHESEILRKMRLIEWLKAELIASVARLYQAIAQNSEQAIKQGLATLVIFCFVLGRRLGIHFGDLDEAIQTRLKQEIDNENDVEKWFGDYSEYQRHLRQKR